MYLICIDLYVHQLIYIKGILNSILIHIKLNLIYIEKLIDIFYMNNHSKMLL